MNRWTVLVVVVVLLIGVPGCDYGAAVVQNLGWGLGGLVQGILQTGTLDGLGAWVSGALVNGAIYGHQ